MTPPHEKTHLLRHMVIRLNVLLTFVVSVALIGLIWFDLGQMRGMFGKVLATYLIIITSTVISIKLLDYLERKDK